MGGHRSTSCEQAQQSSSSCTRRVTDVRAPDNLASDLGGLNKTVRLDQASASDALTRLLADNGGSRSGGRSDRLAEGNERSRQIVGSRAAHKRDGVAMVRFLAWFDKEAPSGKLTEIDAVAALESFRRDTGALKDISFPTIAGAGPKGAIVHYRLTRASNRRIGVNTLFLIGSGQQYKDGTTDITRTSLSESRARRCVTASPGCSRAISRSQLLSFLRTPAAPSSTASARPALAGGTRFRPRYGTWRRQLSVGARGSSADIEIGDRRASARDDPVERTRLLQNGRIWHSHRESSAGNRRAGTRRRRKATQYIRNADAGADRPPIGRNTNAFDEGARLGR